jgi:hypothetical protein
MNPIHSMDAFDEMDSLNLHSSKATSRDVESGCLVSDHPLSHHPAEILMESKTTMIPSIEHVIKKRHHNRRRLRFMALILVVIALMCIGWGGAFGLMPDQTWLSVIPMLVFAAGFLLPAIPLWFFNERMARALVPMPKVECPQCRYNLTALERPVCPECGLALPAAYVMSRPIVSQA